MAYNKHKSFEENVKAIETALTVLSQKRKATEPEKETMSLYSGFGGIKEVLNIGTDKPMPDLGTDRILHPCIYNKRSGTADTVHVQDTRTYDAHIP